MDDIKIIEDSINSNMGLNSEEDIQVSHLSKVGNCLYDYYNTIILVLNRQNAHEFHRRIEIAGSLCRRRQRKRKKDTAA